MNLILMPHLGVLMFGETMLGTVAPFLSGGVVLLAESWLEWIVQPSSWKVILQVAGGLGFVIFVHELGHFLVAKACGVKCEKFYIGFDIGGLKLAKVQWGETEYGIGILPLGGYVKMLGQDDNPGAAGQESARARASGDLPAEPTSDGEHAWDPRSYPAQTVPERMAIISAGVVMNVIFAVVMATVAYHWGIRELTCAVSSVRPGGAAWREGMRTGDEIVGVGAIDDPIFTDLQRAVTLGNAKQGVEFRVQRPSDGALRTLTLYPDTDLGIPSIGVTSPYSTTLPTSLPEENRDEMPGALANANPPLEAGDQIVAVDGTSVGSFAEIVAALSAVPSAESVLTVKRVTVAAEGAPGETTLEVRVPPLPRRVLGMAMTPGGVRAVQKDSPAAAAGVEVGDVIVAVNGEPAGDPLRLEDRLVPLQGTAVTLTLHRGGDAAAAADVVVEPRPVTWVEEARWPSSPVAVSSLGVAIDVVPVVAEVQADGPASAAGIQPGDRVVRAAFTSADDVADEGIEISGENQNWPYVEALLQVVRVDTLLTLSVEGADGEIREVTLTPADASDRFLVERGLLFDPVYRIVKAASWSAALSRGSSRTLEELLGVYRFLQKVTQSEISPRLLGGPIAIAQQAGKSAEEGFGRFLLFLTMLSANLAVVNFLPIPVLDGGHMVFLAYELITGRPPSERVVIALSYVGLFLLLGLITFVFGLDLGFIPRR
jgi:regulator of sigma E protease